ncbi:polysaccharide lyase family 7 protein [Sediminitomix flava]|uniref:F5/8 type C domain-containing protein n=1 Tax=Sediminitomix flava TaxID=379075 RepID=A0A315Z8Z5_SEDFL|nr:polysaccharide lyase family 7 protein [Sediminitomix flava]PWJ41971.1 F5/8 type C domain-containing protein [Sediminitomix flava]
MMTFYRTLFLLIIFLSQLGYAFSNVEKLKGDKLTVTKVTASANKGEAPYFTTDGNFETAWEAEGKGRYITYDLGRIKSVSGLRVAWGSGKKKQFKFKIRVGTSTSNLYTIYNGTSSGKTEDFEDYKFLPQNVRYVRITGFGNSEDELNSISELEIFGGYVKNSDMMVQLPSELMLIYFTQDLTNWKLDTTSDQDGNGKADEVKQPLLNKYWDKKHFKVSEDRKAIVFTAFAGGATTKGSGYPRTELREMTNGGKDKASWSSTEGRHVMEITQAVTNLPYKKKHVVVGQIHDKDDDVIVFRLENRKLFVDINGEDGPVLDSNYKLGKFFTVRFEVSDGKTNCFYNGKLKYTLEKEYEGAYFKAGCYAQSSCQGKKKVEGERCSSFAEVEIRDLWVAHE